MMNQTENQNISGGDAAEALLQQLLHLKQYEAPDASRMMKNKQNIMRLVREANSKKRKSLGDLMEVNMPWFFAEPRYGIALLFVAFAGLQFLSHNRLALKDSHTGIYTTAGNPASLEQNASAATNKYYYPKFPAGSKLFERQQGDGDVKFVGRLESK